MYRLYLWPNVCRTCRDKSTAINVKVLIVSDGLVPVGVPLVEIFTSILLLLKHKCSGGTETKKGKEYLTTA